MCNEEISVVIKLQKPTRFEVYLLCRAKLALSKGGDLRRKSIKSILSWPSPNKRWKRLNLFNRLEASGLIHSISSNGEITGFWITNIGEQVLEQVGKRE
jgi:hypothetical protein